MQLHYLAKLVIIGVIVGIGYALYSKWRERRMLKKFKEWLNQPEPIHTAYTQFIEHIKEKQSKPVLGKGQRRFLKDSEIPEHCEYGVFYIGGMIEGKGLAVWLVAKGAANG